MLEWLAAVLVGVVVVWVTTWWLGYTTSPSSGGKSTGSKDSPAPPEDIPGWTRPPADPVLGDLGEVQACGSLQDYLAQQHQGGKHPIIAFWWRDIHVISTCSPKAFKDAENLNVRPLNIFGRSSAPLHGKNGIENVNGTEWERKKTRLHRTVRGDNLESFISDFVTIAEESLLLWKEGVEQLVLKTAMFCLTLKALLSTSMGLFSEQDEEKGEGLEKVMTLYDFCKKSAEKRMLEPSSPSKEEERVFQESMNSLRCMMKTLLHSRREKTAKGKALPLVDALLASGVPEDEALSDMVTFVGGFHTSGYYMMWVFLYLAQYPDIQDKLVEEMREKVGMNRAEKLKAYVLKSDSYLRQVLDEVLRSSSTVGFSGHMSTQPMIIEGYSIPANTPILQALGVALQDPSSWGEDFMSFKPERFAPGSRHAKRGHEFRPFGVSCGRRCPANLFVYTMISVYLTVLIQHFVVSAADQEFEKNYGIATSPKQDVQVRINLRSK